MDSFLVWSVQVCGDAVKRGKRTSALVLEELLLGHLSLDRVIKVQRSAVTKMILPGEDVPAELRTLNTQRNTKIKT